METASTVLAPPAPERPHATHAPSSLKLREICPGFEQNRFSDQTKADEGTLLHKACETGDLSILVTDEQKSVAKMCLDFVMPIERGATVHKELRLQILDGLSFGTADRVVIRGRRATIIDFKFGLGAVDDAEENRQGYAYLLGVFATFEVDEVEVVFLIPRRDEVLRFTFQRSDVARISMVVRTIIARREEWLRTRDVSLLNPVPEICQYCERIGKCEKQVPYALTIAKKYAPLEMVDEVHSSQVTDPQRMATLFTAARIMEKWAESVKKHAMDLVANGTEIPGYEVRERAGTRAINNPVLAYPILRKYLDPEEIISGTKISVAAMEKLVAGKAPRGKKTEAMAELNRALSDAECVTAEQPIRFLQKIRE